MYRLFPHRAVVCTAIITLGFFLVYAEGIAVVWLVYLYEKDDIVANYCQEFDPAEYDGKAYVAAKLDQSSPLAQHSLPLNSTLKNHSTPTHSLPKQLLNLQEWRAVIREDALRLDFQNTSMLLTFFHHAPTLHGADRSIFHPPRG